MLLQEGNFADHKDEKRTPQFWFPDPFLSLCVLGLESLLKSDITWHNTNLLGGLIILKRVQTYIAHR